MLKVTDICSTDPNKPNSCRSPGDIKIDRTVCRFLSSLPQTLLVSRVKVRILDPKAITQGKADSNRKQKSGVVRAATRGRLRIFLVWGETSGIDLRFGFSDTVGRT